MKHRKLRIALTVVWGSVAVLLIALWVRSYWVQYRLICPTVSKGVIEVDSAAGVVWVVESDLLSTIPWNQTLYQFKLDNKYLPYVHSLQQKTTMGFARFEEYLGLGGIKGRTTVIPHWFLVLVSAALAHVPWIPWSNRFSLRTLLIATTLFAVVLGLIVWLCR
jgi:hypothetical protein